MTLTIGRWGLDPSGKVFVTKWEHDGEVVKIDGLIKATSEAEAYILRDQGLGLANNPDELWVPLTWTEDSTVDGFGRVLDFSCQRVPVLTDKRYVIPFKVRFYRFPGGYSAPDAEEILVGYVRGNSHGFDATVTNPWHAVPAAAVCYTLNSSHDAYEQVLPAADTTGGVVHWWGSTATTKANVFFNKRVNFQLAPAHWYDSGCLITVGGEPVIGRQIPGAIGSTTWAITNHVMTIQPGTAAGILKYRWWDGSTWIDKNFAITNSTSFGNYRHATDALTILRNGPEAVGVRLTGDGGGLGRHQIDLMMRRGTRVADGYFSADAYDAWGVERVESEKSVTALSGSAVKAASTITNKYFIALSAASTFSTEGGIYREVDDNALSFGIGMELDGSSDAMSMDRLIYAWFSPSGTRQTVVAK